MDSSPKATSTSLFQVYLRLRPPHATYASTQAPRELYPQLPPERFLTVEPPTPTEVHLAVPTHITINPPSDSRKRAVERFGFTRVFEEQTSQLDIFQNTGHVDLIDGVIQEGRDGLLATLGVTGSGKSHTILGTRTQRGITQLSLDYLFRSLGSRVVHPVLSPSLVSSLDSADAAESQLLSASNFLDSVYGDGVSTRGQSRATTPAVVTISSPSAEISGQQIKKGLYSQWSLLGLTRDSDTLVQDTNQESYEGTTQTLTNSDTKTCDSMRALRKIDLPAPRSKLAFWNRQPLKRTKAKLCLNHVLNRKQEVFMPMTPRRHAPPPPRPETFPKQPSLSGFDIKNALGADYAVIVSMYEVYNDRIFDLLSTSSTAPNARGERQRRALLFKSTEASPDRKVVAGLRKVVCGSYEEAMMVLETGLMERRVAGTGSNSASSRSHGFFVIEVKKRVDARHGGGWKGGVLSIVDLAGSERAKNAKTAGSALAEAGKINESLMYLGQCLQMQSDMGNEGVKPHLVPFRQCKLTELLFANSFVAGGGRLAQKGIMIVTADPLGDFNATSQILRYSALAREITVPRIPSVASTIGGFTPDMTTSSRPGTAETGKYASSNGRMTPDSVTALGDLVAARGEAERLTDEVAILSMKLAEEQARRRDAEEGWARAEIRTEEIEREVREECFDVMEARLEEEKRRWMALRDEEKDQMDEEMDRKIELLVRGEDAQVKVHEDHPQTVDERVRDLEDENASLRTRLDALERELQCQSPTKSSRKKATSILGNDGKENLATALGKLDLSPGKLPPAMMKSPGKKIRKLTPKTRVFDEDDVFGEDELLA